MKQQWIPSQSKQTRLGSINGQGGWKNRYLLANQILCALEQLRVFTFSLMLPFFFLLAGFCCGCPHGASDGSVLSRSIAANWRSLSSQRPVTVHRILGRAPGPGRAYSLSLKMGWPVWYTPSIFSGRPTARNVGRRRSGFWRQCRCSQIGSLMPSWHGAPRGTLKKQGTEEGIGAPNMVACRTWVWNNKQGSAGTVADRGRYVDFHQQRARSPERSGCPRSSAWIHGTLHGRRVKHFGYKQGMGVHQLVTLLKCSFHDTRVARSNPLASLHPAKTPSVLQKRSSVPFLEKGVWVAMRSRVL